ncbi:MAG TPA: TolC family protein [Brumimicrobium sp.]|nr:TolC family protein [Brumimicrobium sp.]
MTQKLKANVSLVFSLLLCVNVSFSQDTLVLNKAEAEAIFLQNNLFLLAENLSISKAEANLIQAKVWPNPTLTLDQVNLWKPKSIEGQELVPPLSGDFGRNQQFGVSIEQLILTAGKRRKLMALEKVGVEQSKHYFEEVLRSLKIEFRAQLNQLNYLQTYKTIYENQLTSINQLTESYKRQVEAGFLDKGEYIRLKASALEILNDIHTLENELNEVEHNLKQLMNLPSTTVFELKAEGLAVNREKLNDLNIKALVDTAHNNRPDYQISKLQEDYAEKYLAVERAERVPNLALIGEYNRGDAIYTDFVGFGIAIDLPVFNRNRGNIKIAELEIQQAQLNQQFVTSGIEKEVSLAVMQFRRALDFIQQIDEDYESELDQILTAYTQNFMNKNIDLIQYLDFLEAYLENKNIILQAAVELRNKAEELNYAVGKDIIE